MKQINYEKPRTISVDDAVLAELRAENERLVIKANAEHIARQNAEAEADRLRQALSETLCRLSAANEAAGGGFMDSRFREMLEAMGIEVGE
jgi:hypothetical protein